MNAACPIERIARAVLYEGYLLYPYRPTALKNRQRWMFGRICPHEWSLAHDGAESWGMQTECLVADGPQASLSFRVRFLQIAMRSRQSDTQAAAEDEIVQTAVEREVGGEVVLGELVASPQAVQFPFKFGGDQGCRPLDGVVEVTAARTTSGLCRCTISIANLTPVESPGDCPLDEALLSSLVSAHTILKVAAGEFVSLLDPPEANRADAEACRNQGAFPVLVGADGARDAMLSSPIILYDYPQVAAESPGDLFDGTEIDELLTLRIRTLTDQEKNEMSAADPRAKRLLQRSETLDERQFLDLHGRLRTGVAANRAGGSFQAGDRVRLRPRQRADAFDLLLDGSAATVVSVERDFEDRVHLCVVIDADPGKDFGLAGMPGHRFFFRPEEVEMLAEGIGRDGS